MNLPNHSTAAANSGLPAEPAPGRTRIATGVALVTTLLGVASCGPAPPEAGDGPPAPRAQVAGATATGGADPFVDRASELGVDFRHESGAAGRLLMPETTGSGVGLIDYDGDGDLDLYLVQGGWLDQRTPGPSDRLYHNQLVESGRLTFLDATEEAGLLFPRDRDQGYGQGVAVGDYDRDGDPDLFVSAFGPDRLLRNAGGRFEEVPAPGEEDPGWGDPGWSTSAVFADLDRDGWPELFVARYLDYSLGSHKGCYAPQGTPDYCKPLSYAPLPDRLYRNRQGVLGAAPAAELRAAPANGLGVVAADLDDDGWIDLYVTNDQMANHLWLNPDGSGLREDAPFAGVAVNAAGMAEASMGVVLSDFDRDGRLDLLMTHLRGESNTLYRGLGGGMFDDWTRHTRLPATTMPATSFGIAALDFDADGWVDVAVANGSVHLDPTRRPDRSPLPLAETDHLLRNLDGRFAAVTCAAFDLPAVGRGVAVGDLDDDGDPDLVFNDAHGPARVLINSRGPDAAWIGLSLRDAGGRDAGDGVVVTVQDSGGAPRIHVRQRGGSYLSSNDPRVLFGLGDQDGPVTAIVRWTDGGEEGFGPLEIRSYHRLQRGSGTPGSGG